MKGLPKLNKGLMTMNTVLALMVRISKVDIRRQNMIGTKFYKPLSEESETAYSEAASWCNESQEGFIEDKGDWYEVVAIPEPTPEELAEQELQQKKAERAEAVSKITVTVDGMEFDGDEKAQDRMARAITMFQANNLPADYQTDWVLADNTIAKVTVTQLSQALLLAGKEQTALWTVPYQNEETNAGNE